MAARIQRTAGQKVRQFLTLSASGSLAFGAICWFNQNEKFHEQVLMPVVHRLVDPETAHDYAIWALSKRIVPSDRSETPKTLASTNFGLTFKNPVGIAAGFDKNAKAIDGLADIGFGFVEIGSVTPEPQPGNPKPRVFRLADDGGVINRYGFNSDGHDAVLARVKAFRDSDPKSERVLLGVNLGKNKTSPDAVGDYVKGVKKFGSYADYLVINVSSPNTPGLRDMQGKKALSELIGDVIKARDTLVKDLGGKNLPVLLKVAPDLTDKDKEDIVSVISQKGTQVDGLIVSNTTITRPESLKSGEVKSETGGLSGRPLVELSTKTVSDFYTLTNGAVPIIGVGGIFTGADAMEKIKAGASLVQVYSGMVYKGFPIAKSIKKEMAQELDKIGAESLRDAVGMNHRK